MKARHPSLLRSRLLLIGIVAALVVIGAVWVFGPGRVQPAAPQATLAPAPQITFTPPPALSDLAQQFPRLEKILDNPELDSVYKDFLVAYERGGAEAAELLARQRGLLTADNQIRVTLVLDTEDSTALVGELQRLGVVVRGTYKDLIDVGIPLELIVTTAQSAEPGQVFDQITQLEHVINLQLPSPGKPNAYGPEVSFRGAASRRRGISVLDWQPALFRQRFLAPAGLGGGLPTVSPAPEVSFRGAASRRRGISATPATQPTTSFVGFLQPPAPITSEGVKVIGADKWQAAGYTGQGLKIGILDQGFDGYRDLLGRELPSRVSVKSFVPGIEVDQAGVSHGAAVAEVIHDVAPDAELVLAYYDGGDVSMGNAVEWLLQQGVHIISHSAGGLAAPMDGTGRDDELVKLAADNGVLWINSAGNNGTQHYRAAYTDSNHDGVHEFAPDKTLLAFRADPGGNSQIVLTWNDWQPGGTQDLDLFVFDQDGNLTASSRNTRAARDGDRPPVEQIVYKFDDARTYYVTINGVNVTQPITLSLFVHQTPLLEMADPIGSLATPGDAREALTVGAVNWRDNQLEPFSSRGPTADGRLKPDLAGPDGVSNAVYAPQGFYGTSAAAPHIAGAAALVWGAYPQATAAEIRDFLINHAIDLGASGLDNETGAGLLVLSDPPPPPTPAPPTPTSEPGAPTATPQPTATARPIVLATVQRPRPAAASANNAGNWIGVIMIGLALVIGAGLGFSLMRRARSAPQPDRSAAAPQVDRSDCRTCGYRLPAEASFCPQCGRPVINPPVCARCHTPLRPEAKFCGHCGAPAGPPAGA